MRATAAASLFALVCAQIAAQVPAPAASAPDSHTYSNPLGFSYTLPADWQVVDTHSASPAVKEKTAQSATIEAQKKGVACTEIGLTAGHGDPRSVIDEVVLPFGCAGEQLTPEDLPGFGAGAADGIKQNFDIANSQVVSYTLRDHRLWAERVRGTLKGAKAPHYTIEIACALLSKSAVCWMVMAADDSSLADFENGAVTLEDDPPTPLVPAGVFKP